MSTLSKQSIISAASDLLQDASYPPSQRAFSDNSASHDSQTDQTDTLLQAITTPHKLGSELIASLTSSDLSVAERHQQGLHLLSEHATTHSGELLAAASIIVQTSALILNSDRVSLWLYAAGDGGDHDRIEETATYDLKRQSHVTGRRLPAQECTHYLKAIKTHTCSFTEDISKSELRSEPWLAYLLQRNLILHTPGALLEMPIKRQGQLLGMLWFEYEQSHCWSDLEKATVLSISLMATAAIEAEKQKKLSSVLARHTRQLRRETIEREQAEQAWQESQRFIQGIIDASTNILYVDSFEDGSNFYISRWIKNVLGYETHEIQKMGSRYLEQLVHADQKQQIVAERKKLAAINDGEVVENEYQFRHKQGNWRWLLCRETIFQRDEDGQPTQIFGTATDITKRKLAEDGLKDVNKELMRLASMDGLTQVANRRRFDQYLKQEWNNVGTGRSSLSMILCDIDYFKNFNDTYGHQAGDVCLRRVAQAIEKAVKRSTDLVARYGGEEFAIILPNTTVSGLTQVASEIQREIKALSIPHSRSEVSDFITLSLGMAVVTSTVSAHPGMLIAAADQGLYQAKYEGRDRFCLGEIEAEL